MKKVLVTGANGQLGNCIKDASKEYSGLELFFTDKNELSIENESSVKEFFKVNKFDYCINTAAYTNVEKAENEKETAFLINAEGVKHLAEECNNQGTVLIHISTDYVFDGHKKEPYLETDATNPINVYGASKLQGEVYVRNICKKHYIVRTSWLYSQYGHNFVNSILGFVKEGRDLKITTEQTGTPTNANDLAGAILGIVKTDRDQFGTYHYCNEGEATWYDFAEAIIKFSGQLGQIKLEKTDHYRTFAERPKYSVLNNKKLGKNFNIEYEAWSKSLEKLISKK